MDAKDILYIIVTVVFVVLLEFQSRIIRRQRALITGLTHDLMLNNDALREGTKTLRSSNEALKAANDALARASADKAARVLSIVRTGALDD